MPLPDGFVELTPEMTPYYESMKAYIAPNNVRYLTLIAQAQAEALLRGEDVELSRFINVESEKGISASSVSTAQFSQLRSIFRNQIDALYENVEAQLPKMVGDASKALSEEFAADLAVELGGLAPLPIHLDSANAIANSMYMTVGATVNGEDMGSDVQAVTSLVLHVTDKVLFIYVYGEESDLEWTRQTAEMWAAVIDSANRLPGELSSSVGPSDSFGIDWRRVLEKALVGVIIGGLVGLLINLLGKRKAR